MVCLTFGLLLGSSAVASAEDTQDPRAIAHDGNVTTCGSAGVSGTLLKPVVDYQFTGGVPNVDQYVTITGVSGGVTVSAVVVKGGDGYNVYVPGRLGLPATPPWTNLRSPLNGGGNIPQISHWYVCGTVTTPSSITGKPTTTRTSRNTTTSGPAGETTTGSTAGRSSSSMAGGAAAAATSTSSVVNTNQSNLAHTGFNGGWLVGLGAVLVLGGAALLVVLRVRRKA